jgi:hypothetical protein
MQRPWLGPERNQPWRSGARNWHRVEHQDRGHPARECGSGALRYPPAGDWQAGSRDEIRSLELLRMPILVGRTRRLCVTASGRSCGTAPVTCSLTSGPSTTTTARSSTATGISSTTSSPTGSSSFAIAPVRPSLKDRYPTIPVERYALWTRPDGSPFDPWVRVHTLLGARIGPVIPSSLHITGTVQEWESWTQMRFPETGDYVFPAGLATVHIDRERDLGEYWEPNIWIIHTPSPVT